MYSWKKRTRNKSVTMKVVGTTQNILVPWMVFPQVRKTAVHEYESIKAEYQGLEVEIDWLALENPGWDLLFSAYGDCS